MPRINMPWAIVKQPNGLYARFSTISDNFTHLNMSRTGALACAAHYLSKFCPTAEGTVQNAEKRTPEDEYSWEDCVETIHEIHGVDAVDEIAKEVN